MKETVGMKTAILFLSLLLACAALANPPSALSQSHNGFDAFWQKFKTAVFKSDKETVVSLSRFPIRMPGRIRNIKDAADLRSRYREVFNQHANAAKCFREQDPFVDPSNNKRIAIQCESLNKKYDVAEYVFELTFTGWKFVRLDLYELPD
jgi:hypothetical protein